MFKLILIIIIFLKISSADYLKLKDYKLGDTVLHYKKDIFPTVPVYQNHQRIQLIDGEVKLVESKKSKKYPIVGEYVDTFPYSDIEYFNKLTIEKTKSHKIASIKYEYTGNITNKYTPWPENIEKRHNKLLNILTKKYGPISKEYSEAKYKKGSYIKFIKEKDTETFYTVWNNLEKYPNQEIILSLTKYYNKIDSRFYIKYLDNKILEEISRENKIKEQIEEEKEQKEKKFRIEKIKKINSQY